MGESLPIRPPHQENYRAILHGMIHFVVSQLGHLGPLRYHTFTQLCMCMHACVPVQSRGTSPPFILKMMPHACLDPKPKFIPHNYHSVPACNWNLCYRHRSSPTSINYSRCQFTLSLYLWQKSSSWSWSLKALKTLRLDFNVLSILNSSELNIQKH